MCVDPEKQLENRNAIKATGIPTDTTDEEIWLYFEKIVSGGDVANVDFDKLTNSAVISFKDDYGMV